MKEIKKSTCPEELLPRKMQDALNKYAEKLRRYEKKLREFRAGGGDKPKKPKKPKLSNHWSHAKESLYESQEGKCCYCERKRDKKREMDVEHYRPKGGIKDDKNHPGYWWLAYDWDNLLLACKTCNQEYKETHFPIQGQRAYYKNDNLEGEKPYLLNPAIDTVKDRFAYVVKSEEAPIGFIKPRDNSDIRARKTIALLGLNTNPELVAERQRFFNNFRSRLKSQGSGKSIQNWITHEFTGFGEFLLKTETMSSD